jgi:hypothetical protein
MESHSGDWWTAEPRLWGLRSECVLGKWRQWGQAVLKCGGKGSMVCRSGNHVFVFVCWQKVSTQSATRLQVRNFHSHFAKCQGYKLKVGKELCTGLYGAWQGWCLGTNQVQVLHPTSFWLGYLKATITEPAKYVFFESGVLWIIEDTIWNEVCFEIEMHLKRNP